MGQCEAPTAPDTSCALRLGESAGLAATFDAAGRLTSFKDGSFGKVWVLDATGQPTRLEWVDARCVTQRTLYWRDGDRVVSRLDDARGRPPKCFTQTFVGEVEAERVGDLGCDCQETWFEDDCDIEDGRRVRCEGLTPDGRSMGIETWTWTADGLLARYSEDDDGDGVEDDVEVFEYDAAGRVTVELETHTRCRADEACTVRWTWTYEDDLRRTTERRDDWDDGSVQRIVRTTVDEIGRRVLVESSFDDGVTWTVTAWIREVDGNRTTITRTQGGVAQRVIVEEVDDAGRLLSRRDNTDQGNVETLDLRYDDGRIIEERRSAARDGDVLHDCAVDYRWEGEACPVLRVPTDADVTPPEEIIPVGKYCLSRNEG